MVKKCLLSGEIWVLGVTKKAELMEWSILGPEPEPEFLVDFGIQIISIHLFGVWKD